MAIPLHTAGAPTRVGGVAAPAPTLADEVFVVLDLETTGTAPHAAAITEIGAAKYRCGHRLGTFSTLVDPGVAIPPLVTALTGITDGMVSTAPPITAVLPSFVEFVGGATVVGHNVAFDRGFLDAALGRDGRAPLPAPCLDTLTLARAMLGDEVPNHRLATLARHFRTEHRPCHRALADALATADLLHALIERAGTFGVFDLPGLLAFEA